MHPDLSPYGQGIASGSKTSLGAHGRYEVVYTRVAVRRSPSTQAEAVGVLNCGAIIQGWPYSVKGNPWLELDIPSCDAFTCVIDSVDAQAWVLIHGKSVGLEELLSVTKKRFEVPKSIPSSKVRRHWFTSYRVIEPEVWIMPKSDPMQKQTESLGRKVCGEIVRGDQVIINNFQWLRLEFNGFLAWMLIDGKAIGVQRQFLQVCNDEPVPWEVLEKEVWVMPKADPKQSHKDSLGVKLLNEIVRGSAVMVGGVEWLQVSHNGNQAWILIDGQAVNVNRKFLRCGQRSAAQGTSKAETWVSERGTLSTRWLLAQGGLASVPWSISEGVLDASLNVGLASSISVLHIERGEDCRSEKYIVKRSGFGGSSVFHTDQRLLERECRFYLEVCRDEQARMKNRQKLSRDEDRKRQEEEAEVRRRLHEKREEKQLCELRDLRVDEQRRRETRGTPFDGCWEDNDGAMLTIKGCSMWDPDGTELQFSIHSNTTCAIALSDEKFEGELLEDGSLLWSDGAKWVRQKSEAEKSLLQRHEEARRKSEATEKEEACLSDATREDAKARKKAWSSQLGPPDLLLGGSLRVPRCLGAEWEEGCDDAFVLVLEMFEQPFWKSAGDCNESAGFGSESGCSLEQAFSAMKALGHFHRMFHGNSELHKYGWLPVTTLHIENAMHFQERYQAVLGTMEFMLVNVLSARAFQTCKKLQNHYAEMVMRLAQPPLTLVHGDFHPGNVRFSATSPPVTAAFDWQFCCQCRGAYDFAYFLALFAPPELRRKYENDLSKCYLEASGRQSEGAIFIDEVRAALLVVFAFFVMVHMSSFQIEEARRSTSRYVSWIGYALDDWGCDQLMN